MNTAFTILVVLIIIASILLIAVVLLQSGKEGMASNFTSANQTLGVRQTATILEKATWYLVSFILVLSIVTVFVGRGSTQRGSADVISNEIINQVSDGAQEMPAFPIQESPEVQGTPEN